LVGVLPEMMPKLIAEASASSPEFRQASEPLAELAEIPAAQP
jgi:hypothetical protein